MATDPQELPPLTLKETIILNSLVHIAKNIQDLGAKPMRVWRIDGRCEEHFQDISEEIETFGNDKPPTAGVTVKCHLCAVRKHGNPYCKAHTIVLLRG